MSPTRDEIEQFLKTQHQNSDFPGKWYQGGITFPPYDLVTENPNGELGDCRKIWELLDLKPEDINEKTMLDVGCDTGFYAMEWVRRGGASAHGFDSNPRSAEIAGIFAGWRGLENVTYSCSDFYLFDWKPKSYDVVFALQILYHVALSPGPPDPERALATVAAAAKEKLVLILRNQPPQNFWTLESLIRQLEENGFRMTYLRDGTTVQGKWVIKAERK